jgi:hypothetical protein
VLGIAAVVAAIVYLRPADSPGGGTRAGTSGPTADTSRVPTVRKPASGPVLSLGTPEGYGYGVAAIKAGTDARPLGPTRAPGEGLTYAYADYVITNTEARPAMLDYPADLFMPLEQVPESARSRCMPQAGIPEGMCTLPNHSQVTARIRGSAPLIVDGADKLIPPNASYIIRIATDVPVKDGTQASDLKLYVWNARFTNDRKGIELTFP